MSEFRQTRAWLRARRALAAARAALRAEGDVAAAEALWRLNRSAKRLPMYRSRIYAMKTSAIRVLHERHGATVRLHVQTLRCWGDRYEGCGPDCWRCDGTGIYKQHRLLLFVFELGGRRYSWHQPERLVTWPVSVEPGEADYGEVEGAGEGFPFASSEDFSTALATVWSFLKAAGVPRTELPQVPRLWESVLVDLQSWWLNLRPVKAVTYRWWKLKRRLRDAWDSLRPEVPPHAVIAGSWEPDYDDDDLPF